MLAMNLALGWNMPTLCLSADTSRDDITGRLAACITGDKFDWVQAARDRGDGKKYEEALADSKIVLSFKNPITWQGLEYHLEAYVEVYDEFPAVFIVDNLKDIDGAESEYSEQMQAMQRLTELCRYTGSTIIVLHHATDKGWEARAQPASAPSRDQIKNGMSEQPEVTLSVGHDATTGTFNIAVLKQRNGRTDPGAQHPIRIFADLSRSHFARWGLQFEE